MRKICFVTSARSEFGVLKWLMKEICSSSEFDLQIIVTGAHLLNNQGHTVDQILEEGFVIDHEVDIQLNYDTKASIAESMGRLGSGMASAFALLKPDYIVVLGDRYELLPICNSAFVMNIPIIHISGGDVTIGAIDNGIRNAVSMLSTFHFPGTEDSALNLKRMLGSSNNIWAVGELGLDAFRKEKLLDRTTTAELLGLDINKKWVLMTYHPETLLSLEDNMNAVINCCSVLKSLSDIQVVMTYANTDFGGKSINEYIEKSAIENGNQFKCVPSLGNLKYLSLMKQVVMVIGNSSSGIIEAPSLKIPVVNIGNRQTGRHFCSNIIQCGGDFSEINEAVTRAINDSVDDSDLNYWGDGKTAGRILEILRTQIE